MSVSVLYSCRLITFLMVMIIISVKTEHKYKKFVLPENEIILKSFMLPFDDNTVYFATDKKEYEIKQDEEGEILSFEEKQRFNIKFLSSTQIFKNHEKGEVAISSFVSNKKYYFFGIINLSTKSLESYELPDSFGAPNGNHPVSISIMKKEDYLISYNGKGGNNQYVTAFEREGNNLKLIRTLNDDEFNSEDLVGFECVYIEEQAMYICIQGVKSTSLAFYCYYGLDDFQDMVKKSTGLGYLSEQSRIEKFYFQKSSTNTFFVFVQTQLKELFVVYELKNNGLTEIYNLDLDRMATDMNPIELTENNVAILYGTTEERKPKLYFFALTQHSPQLKIHEIEMEQQADSFGVLFGTKNSNNFLYYTKKNQYFRFYSFDYTYCANPTFMAKQNSNSIGTVEFSKIIRNQDKEDLKVILFSNLYFKLEILILLGQTSPSSEYTRAECIANKTSPFIDYYGVIYDTSFPVSVTYVAKRKVFKNSWPSDVCQFNIRIGTCYYSCLSCTDVGNEENQLCIDCPNEYHLFEDTGNCVQEIPPGYYLDIKEDKIKKCFYKCKTCTKGGTEAHHMCTQCQDGLFPVESSFNCLNKNEVLQGYYFDQVENMYKKCYKTCKECNGLGDEEDNICLSCRDNLYFLEDTANCLEKVPQGYYINYSEGRIRKCFENCEECVEFGENKCTVCKDGLYFFEDTQTCKSVENGYYVDKEENKIKKCYETCSSCSFGGDDKNHNCTSCGLTFYPQEGTKNCFSSAVDGYYFDPEENIIKKCYHACALCDSYGDETNTNCEKCSSGYFFFEDTKNCLGTAPPGYGISPEDQRIRKCHSNCKTCNLVGSDQENKCVSCKKNLFLFDDTSNCLESIPQGYYYDEELDKLKKCYESCLDCYGKGTAKSNNCKSCQKDYNYLPSIKGCFKDEIPDGYYLDSADSQIKRCYNLCSKCEAGGNSKNNNCKECINGYIRKSYYTKSEKDKTQCIPICNPSFSNWYLNASDDSVMCSESKDDCPVEYPFLNLTSGECVDYVLDAKKSFNIKAHFSKETIKPFLSRYMKEILVNNETLHFDKVTVYISTTQEKNKFFDTSECVNNLLSTAHSAADKKKFSTVVIEYENTKREKSFEYKIYNDQGNDLDLSACNSVSFTIPLEDLNLRDLFNRKFDLFNVDSSFFNDYCSPIRIEDKDTTTSIRREYYMNSSLCNSECSFEYFDEVENLIKCSCKVQKNKIYRENGGSEGSFRKISSSNLKYFKCLKSFNGRSIKYYLSIIILIEIGAQVILFAYIVVSKFSKRFSKKKPKPKEFSSKFAPGEKKKGKTQKLKINKKLDLTDSDESLRKKCNTSNSWMLTLKPAIETIYHDEELSMDIYLIDENKILLKQKILMVEKIFQIKNPIIETFFKPEYLRKKKLNRILLRASYFLNCIVTRVFFMVFCCKEKYINANFKEKFDFSQAVTIIFNGIIHSVFIEYIFRIFLFLLMKSKDGQRNSTQKKSSKGAKTAKRIFLFIYMSLVIILHFLYLYYLTVFHYIYPQIVKKALYFCIFSIFIYVLGFPVLVSTVIYINQKIMIKWRCIIFIYINKILFLI